MKIPNLDDINESQRSPEDLYTKNNYTILSSLKLTYMWWFMVQDDENNKNDISTKYHYICQWNINN